MKHLIAGVLIAFSFSGTAFAADPEWIWSSETKDNQSIFFRLEINIEKDIESAIFSGAGDDQIEVFVNGKRIGRHRSWKTFMTMPLKTSLIKGKNIIALAGRNGSSLAGVIGRATITYTDGSKDVYVTNTDWKSSKRRGDGWDTVGFDDSKWKASVSLGAIGKEGLSWSNAITMAALENAEKIDLDPSPVAKVVDNLNLLPGFKAELLYTVPKGMQGSWVSMTNAPQGGFYVSDQGDAGIYHVQPAELGNADSRTVITSIPAPVSGAHGLFYAFDSLYAHVSEGNKKGLYRITDSDQNGELDKADYITPINGGGEHGPHAIMYTEDKKDLYIVAGNHTYLPEISGSQAPTNWGEDLLLPRRWDPSGHAKGRMAPGGWITRTSPDGKSWHVYSTGFRNQYDIAMNTENEMFSFDADMEYDQGSPWYRPTRVCHVVSGSEFGWRGGTGKWPTYYEDSTPPVLNIGPGSPVGIVFGTDAKFPAKYQQALFILDWTFGTIHAVHMTPEGASYTATKEEFVSGSPLPVTDTAIGTDGAFYFTVGGRGTDSALYRVYYAGEEETAPAKRQESQDTIDARKLRRMLEEFHGHEDPKAIETAWSYMGHEDRFIRFAARIAVENQPVEQWSTKALSEKDPLTAALAMIALSRQGHASLQPYIIKALNRIDLSKTDEVTTLAALRAYALCLTRMRADDMVTISDTGIPQGVVNGMINRLDPLLPSKSDNINGELVRLLVYLESPTIIEKGLALLHDAKPSAIPDWAELIKRNAGYGGTIAKMLANYPPQAKINYTLMLRNVQDGWTLDQRRDYFGFINEAGTYNGGNQYASFLGYIREDALAHCTDEEKAALKDLTDKSLVKAVEFEITETHPVDTPWTVASAEALINERGLKGRDFKNGRNAYHAVSCVLCHQFDGVGGAIGPDLTTVSGKFSIRDLLEAIIEPSAVISDQYNSSMVTMKNGDLHDGIVINTSGSRPDEKDDGTDEVKIYTKGQDEPIVVKSGDIKSVEESKVSQMPEGLTQMLNEDELLDMMAYLLSRGNAENKMFK
jgi:putative heme-binding domain-containing protein